MDTEEQAFQKLKQICASYPVLCTPDWTHQFILETDASGYALRAVIMQEFDDGVHPISFNSCSLLSTEKNYDTHDKELVGMIFSFKCGQQYFLGAQHPIHVRTDHKNLQYFKEPQKITGHQACWMEFLQDFDYHIEHIPGTMNTIADLLSRCKDLTRGWIPIHNEYFSLTPCSSKKSSLKTTKTLEETSYDRSTMPPQE